MKTVKSIYYIPALLFMLSLFSSCLKDSGPVQDFSQSPPVVSFQGNGQGNNTGSISVVASTTADNPTPDSVGVALGVSSLTLSTPVTVTTVVDQATLDAYNTAHSTSYTLLPTNSYVLQNGGSWVIPAGKSLVYFPVSFIGTNIDFTKDNAIALKISSAPGTTVADNLNTFVIAVHLKSLFENTYAASGEIVRFPAATPSNPIDSFPIAGSPVFSTVSSDQVDGLLPIAGFSAVQITLQVNSDNTVIIKPSAVSPGVPATNTAGKTSYYDPATKTFFLYGEYLNAAGALRQFHAVLVGS